MKLIATISSAAGTALISTTVVTDSLSIPAFTSVWGLLVGVNFSGITILLPQASVAFQKSSYLLTVEQEKLNSIKNFSPNKTRQH